MSRTKALKFSGPCGTLNKARGIVLIGLNSQVPASYVMSCGVL